MPANHSSRPIAVVGGGVTGLCAAYRLTQLGHPVRLFEATDRLGGAIRSESTDGWLVEGGPNSFQENSREISALISDLGLEPIRISTHSAAKNRYIVRGGKLCPVPSSPRGLATTPLFSARSKLRLLKELFSRPRERVADVSLHDFVRDHFGQEIVDYALSPFVSGVYAGDPRKLSARYAFPTLWESERSHGSLIRGLIAQAKSKRSRGEPKSRIISFQTGLQTLTDALTRRLSPQTLELNGAVDCLGPGPPWKVSWSTRGERREEEFSSVILALPARSLASLSFGLKGDCPLDVLRDVEYPPVASLFLGFRREQITHALDGFGALVPFLERSKLLGVLFSSTVFPGRAPDGHVALTVMVGGSMRPDLAQLSKEELTDTIMPELSALLGAKGSPVFTRLTVWPRAIPQYNLGHDRIIDAIARCEKAHPGLFIGGQISDGISLPSCAQAGLKLAARVADR